MATRREIRKIETLASKLRARLLPARELAPRRRFDRDFVSVYSLVSYPSERSVIQRVDDVVVTTPSFSFPLFSFTFSPPI